MKDKKWILGLVILVIVIGGLSIWGFKKSENKTSSVPAQVASESTPNYYSEDASVMEFYSDYCSWCIKEKDVLTKLGNEGYKVKPMNVGADPDLATQYKIFEGQNSGTPTFIAKNGDRLVGYQEYNTLKAWLDQHK